MKILITGASGLIGSDLTARLTEHGDTVQKLVRKTPASRDEIHWDPTSNMIERAKLEALDAVVHLGGESIAAGRWTPEKKQRIRDSRLKGTRLLSDALANAQIPPKVLVCASASGYYGNRGTEILTDDNEPGSGFLAELCVQWEAAANAARVKGIRVVNLRFGIVLSERGGALAKMLTPFKMGVGGPIGSGQQYWSWIALDDTVQVIIHALNTESLHGGVNTVAPNPVTNAEFTSILGSVLKRPAVVPMPAALARLALGEMANELLLASARMMPAKLIASGFVFQYPDLAGALYHLLR